MSRSQWFFLLWSFDLKAFYRTEDVKVIHFFHKEKAKAILSEFIFILYSYKMKIHHETLWILLFILLFAGEMFLFFPPCKCRQTAKLSRCFSRDFFQKSTKICFNVRYLTLMNKSFDVFCTTISQREVQGHSCNRGHKQAQKLGESKSIL